MPAEGIDLTSTSHDPLVIAGREFRSRLITGTGKYPSFDVMREAVVASGCELVTVAVRRLDLDREAEAITDWLPEDVLLLPNTAGCETAEEAVRVARLARAGGLPDWIKLEVIPDPTYLLPDGEQTLEALARRRGLHRSAVRPAGPGAQKLEDAGCATVMPLASPIGSGRGLKLRHTIEIMIEQAEVPLIIDAGLRPVSGGREHGARRGRRARQHRDRPGGRPRCVAGQAFKLAVEAGRAARLAGLIEESEVARPSSPISGLITR